MKEEIKLTERRKGPDFWCRWVRIFSILNWVVIGVILMIVDSARPVSETFIDRIFNNKVKNYWDVRYLRFSLYLAIFLFICAGVSLLANLKRLKRKDDRISISNIVSFLLAGFLTVFFATYLF